MKYDRALEVALGLENPAWDFVKEIPEDDLLTWGKRSVPTFSQFEYRTSGGVDLEHPKFYRSYVTGRWAWGIPSPDAVARILVRLDGRPVVEVGAGNGYWAWLLTQAGIDVKAYDIAPIGHPKSWFKDLEDDERGGRLGSISGFDSFVHQEFVPVKQGGPEVLRWTDNADRALFLCWPTMSSFAADSVEAYQGDLIVYIGEGQSGCNADSEFFWLTEGVCDCWDYDHDEDGKCSHADKNRSVTYKAEHHAIAQWGGLHDNLVFYAKES